MNEVMNSRRQFVNGLSADGAAVALAGIYLASPADGKAIPLLEGLESEQGAWVADFVTDDGRTLRGFTTFARGDEVALNAARPASIGHGKWVQDGQRVDALTIRFLLNASGRLVGFTETCSCGEMNESGDLFCGRATVKTYDLRGRVVTVQRGKMVARRRAQ
jgi:hypothetical protein